VKHHRSSPRLIACAWAFALAGAVYPHVATCATSQSQYRSPFDLAFGPDGKTLAVSDRTAGLLYLIDADAGRVGKSVKLKGDPRDVTWARADAVFVSEYEEQPENE